METKKFNCKMQDIPVILGFVLASFERDKSDFINYSPMFADSFAADTRIKQSECYEIVKAGDVLKLQKAKKSQIDVTVDKFRVSLNKTEGYLKLAVNDLDIKLEDFGVKSTRSALSKSDLEKAISEGRSLVMNLKRNTAKLIAKGLKQEGIDELASIITELETLNEEHNTLKNSRSRAAGDNYALLNETWDIINTILSAGRAIYKGTDPIKLKEYTLSNLQKRVYNVNNGSQTTEETAK